MAKKKGNFNIYIPLTLIIIALSTQGICQSSKEYGLFYSIPYFEPKQINPIHGSYYLEGVQANELMYSRLWTWKKDISETSDLIDNISPSGFGEMIRTPGSGQGDFSWEIEIRPKVHWPDGVPLSAEDVKFSFEVYNSEVTRHSLRPWLKLIKNIKVINSTTLQFYVDQKNLRIAQYILPLVQILPKHRIQSNYLAKNSEFAKRPMGSGPFQYNPDSHTGDNQYNFIRNDYYYKWGPLSNISSVNIYVERILSSVITKISVEDREENWETLDLLISVPNSPLNYDNLYEKAKDHLTFESYSSNSWYAIAINCEKQFLANQEVRQALTIGVNIQNAIRDHYAKVHQGGSDEPIAKRISGPFNPLWGMGDATISPRSYDPSGADIMLSNNGSRINNNHRQFKGNNVNLKFIYNMGRVFQGSPEELVINQLINDFKRLKIEVTPVRLPEADFEKALAKGDYDLAFQYYELGYGSNIAPLFTKGDIMNISNFSDPVLTAYLNSYNRTSGVPRGDIGRDIHQLIYEKSPYIFLYRLDKIMAYRKEFKTEGDIVPNYFFTHIGDWYFRD
jgi:peptide/nickel transport system substrate-binding protein